MGIYLKKLKSVKALEKEKALLLKERAELANFKFPSVRSIISNKDDAGAKSDVVSEIISLLPVSDSVAKIATTVVNMFFAERAPEASGTISEKKKKKRKKTEKGSKNKNGILLNLAYEILGGYLKWKAIELSFKGIKYLVKKRKEKVENDKLEKYS